MHSTNRAVTRIVKNIPYIATCCFVDSLSLSAKFIHTAAGTTIKSTQQHPIATHHLCKKTLNYQQSSRISSKNYLKKHYVSINSLNLINSLNNYLLNITLFRMYVPISLKGA